MARRKRIHYFGATYHVMTRGNFRQPIFSDELDYELYYSILDNVTKQYDCKIHLFCLMTNHVHMVIEVGQVPLSKIMQHISSVYSQKINLKLNRQGHLFQGRYKDKIVQSNQYLLELCHYIHQNPFAANMIKEIDDYLWSSHQVYSGKQCLNWVTVDRIFSLLHSEFPAASNPYTAYINKNEPRSEYLGFNSDGKIVEKYPYTPTTEPAIIQKINLNLDEIISIVADYIKIKPSSLSMNYSSHASLTRSLITYFAHYYADYFLVDVAIALERSANNISRQMHKLIKRSYDDKSLQKKFDEISRKLFCYACDK